MTRTQFHLLCLSLIVLVPQALSPGFTSLMLSCAYVMGYAASALQERDS